MGWVKHLYYIRSQTCYFHVVFYLFVGSNAGWATEVELRSFNRERLTGA